MHMTKGHFELIARTVHTLKYEQETTRCGDGFTAERVAREFAHALHSTNPNFNRAKFLTACGVGE